MAVAPGRAQERKKRVVSEPQGGLEGQNAAEKKDEGNLNCTQHFDQWLSKNSLTSRQRGERNKWDNPGSCNESLERRKGKGVLENSIFKKK